MTDEQTEIKILKRALHAQTRTLAAMRLGRPSLPLWVFDALERARIFYKVPNIGDIK